MKRKQVWMTTRTSICIQQWQVLLPSRNPQKGRLLWPMVSSRDSVTFWVAEELAAILKPLVGKSPHHLHNTQSFVESIKDFTVQPAEFITSYDVTVLFTLVPTELAIDITENKLQKDYTLWKRIQLTTQHQKEHQRFCLHSTYFLFQGKYYEQVKGVAMGSPVSPVLANLCMEFFEEKALRTAQNATRLWKGL